MTKMKETISDRTKLKQKIALLEIKSQSAKEDLESELELTKKKVTGLGKLVLAVGAGLAFSVIVFGGRGSKRRKKVSTPSVGTRRVYHRFIDQLVSELTFRATDFIVEVAKDKFLGQKNTIEIKESDDSEFTD